MALLDWSDPQKTPREPSTRPVSGDGCPPRGRTEAGLSPVSVRPLTGSLADYDALADAVSLYRWKYERAAYEAMRDAATRCGMPQGEPPLAWATRRLRTFQHTMETA